MLSKIFRKERPEGDKIIITGRDFPFPFSHFKFSFVDFFSQKYGLGRLMPRISHGIFRPKKFKNLHNN
jgi:hypothetical protein